MVGMFEDEASILGCLFFGGLPRFFGTLPFAFFAERCDWDEGPGGVVRPLEES